MSPSDSTKKMAARGCHRLGSIACGSCWPVGITAFRRDQSVEQWRAAFGEEGAVTVGRRNINTGNILCLQVICSEQKRECKYPDAGFHLNPSVDVEQSRLAV